MHHTLGMSMKVLHYFGTLSGSAGRASSVNRGTNEGATVDQAQAPKGGARQGRNHPARGGTKLPWPNPTPPLARPRRKQKNSPPLRGNHQSHLGRAAIASPCASHNP